MLQYVLERTLTPEACLQLAKDVHLGRSPQVMKVFTGVSTHHIGLDRCVHQVNARDSQTRSNACWKCRVLGHFQKNCKAILNSQGSDRDEQALSDTNPTISQMSHTLTTSTPILNLTFKAILKELVSLLSGNRKAFCQKPKIMHQRPTVKPLHVALAQL